jgi:hypothetical protein
MTNSWCTLGALARFAGDIARAMRDGVRTYSRFDNGDLLSRRLHLRVKPQPVRPSAINMILGQWTFFKLAEA